MTAPRSFAQKQRQPKAMPEGPANTLCEWYERRKAQIRVIALRVPRHQVSVPIPRGQLLRGRQERSSRSSVFGAGRPVLRQSTIADPRGQCVRSVSEVAACGHREVVPGAPMRSHGEESLKWGDTVLAVAARADHGSPEIT